MLIQTFRMAAGQKRKLDEIAEDRKLGSLSETVRFLIDHYKKEADDPKASEKAPALVPMWNDPEVQKKLDKILKILKVMGSSAHARAKAEIDMILEE